MQSPKRPSWDTYFAGIAEAVSKRADCRRRQYGAVIVKNNRIISTGYNGTPAGSSLSCLNGDCPRGLLTETECVPNAPDYGNCIALHAEQNAIAHARTDTEGAVLYLNKGEPCDMCVKLIQAAGIARIVTGTRSTCS